jgi:hypothetical protein
LLHGLTTSFEVNGGLVMFNNWQPRFRIFGYFIGAFIILRLLDFLRITPNRTAITIAFWGFSISNFYFFSVEEIFTGYEYPPIWQTLTHQQRGVLSWAGYYPGAVFTSSIMLFLATVIYEFARRTPSAAIKAVRFIRSL